MIKKILLAAALVPALSSSAIIWKYGNFDVSKKECRIIGWHGSLPSSGKLTLPSKYTDEQGTVYTVTRVDGNALDSLTTVTQITIPAETTRIGHSGKNVDTYDFVTTNNFNACPNLVKFIVSEDNKYFKTTAEGCLIRSNQGSLLKVPAKVAVTDGKLTLSQHVARICKDAFSGNTTVKTLELWSGTAIEENGGLNKARNLAKYMLKSSDDDLVLIDEAIYYKTGNHLDLISLPPASAVKSIVLPNKTTRVSEYALYNCTNLRTVDLVNVSLIADYAFSRSGITSVTIPSTVQAVYEGAFQKCPNLKTIVNESDRLDVPKYFARQCPQLTKVTSVNAFHRLWDEAFKGCSNLTSFPFSAATIYNDGAFHGCGFSKVVFPDDKASEFDLGEDLFASNANLELLDMSAISGIKDDPYCLSKNMTANCPKLETIKLPRYCILSLFTESPVFGPNCTPSKIVMGSLSSNDGAQFVYAPVGDKKNFSPRVLVTGTGNRTRMEYSGLFSGRQGATVTPNYIIDLLIPTNEAYVDKNADYYVPGGARAYYSEAKDAGCTVKEFYDIEFKKSDNRLRVKIGQDNRPSKVPGLSDIVIDFGDGTPKNVSTGGAARSECGYDNVREVKISYTCSGVRMCTVYGKSKWNTTGIDDVPTEDAPESGTEYYTIDGIKVEKPVDGSIYIERHANGTVRVRR